MLFAGRPGGVAPLGKRTRSSESPVDWTSNRRYGHADARKRSQSQPRNKTKSLDPFSSSTPPKGTTDPKAIDRWQIGVAGCWPDIIRRSAADRPTWHYQLGSSLALGNVTPPDDPGALPDGATLDTQELYVGQAFDLCRQVFADRSRPDAERAVALCWLCHLVADGHQPCHAGSLYAEGVFPKGDRGGNSIKIGRRGNLHSTWDGLLGGNASEKNVLRRVAELKADQSAIDRVNAHREQFSSTPGAWVESSLWLGESRQAAVEHVYTAPVIDPVTITMRGLVKTVEIAELPEAYYQNAGRVARVRAVQAGYRLADVMTMGISSP